MSWINHPLTPHVHAPCNDKAGARRVQYKKILLPTDGSDLPLRAAQAGVGLAASLKASVVAFHGMTPLPALAVMGEVVELNAGTLAVQTAELARAYLADIRKRAAKAEVPCETEYVSTKRA